MMDHSKLLSQHCLVYQTEFLKPKTPFTPRKTNSVPIDKVHLPNPFVMTLLEISG